MSGQNWLKSGSMDGTGALITVALGFAPRKVELFNSEGLSQALKTDTMAADSSIKTITAGTMTFPADLITITSNGFTIGTDSDVNVAGEALHWVAWQAQND